MLVILQEHGVAARPLDGLSPAEVSVTHYYELIDETAIALRTYRMQPAHNKLARSEVQRYLAARIIKPAILA